MDNNEILIRLRYALDIKDANMVKIFKLGGVEVTTEEVRKLLIKSKETYRYNNVVGDHVNPDEIEEAEENIKCKNSMLESFLNGLIIFKRGKQDPKQGQPQIPVLTKNENPNNIMLKKLKIALSLTSDDVLDILKEADVIVTKAELSALLRKEGHKHYKECGDRYARNFIKGLAIRNRGRK